MKSTASAPGKVILLGEHFVVYGIEAVLCAIDRRITVETRTVGSGITILSGMGSARIEPGGSTDAALAPIAHIATEAVGEFGHGTGLEITVRSDIPPGVGLGSSSACCVAAAASITGVFAELSRDEILRRALEAERTVFGGASGADTAASTYGGAIRYSTAGGFDGLRVRDLELVVANSMQAHSTGEMVRIVGRFREENREEFDGLCARASELTGDALAALGRGDRAALGGAMSESQRMLEAIGVSNARLRRMTEVADRTGLGSKITGAGGGGCIIALADGPGQRRMQEDLQELGCECFTAGIDHAGLRVETAVSRGGYFI